MHTYTPATSILNGPIKKSLSVLGIVIKTFSHARVKGQTGLNGFTFGTFIGRFSSDGAESMAVKELMAVCCNKVVVSFLVN